MSLSLVTKHVCHGLLQRGQCDSDRRHSVNQQSMPASTVKWQRMNCKPEINFQFGLQFGLRVLILWHSSSRFIWYLKLCLVPIWHHSQWHRQAVQAAAVKHEQSHCDSTCPPSLHTGLQGLLLIWNPHKDPGDLVQATRSPNLVFLPSWARPDPGTTWDIPKHPRIWVQQYYNGFYHKLSWTQFVLEDWATFWRIGPGSLCID